MLVDLINSNRSFFFVFLFALGTVIGSFLNVLIYRIPRGENFVSERSRCPKCGHQLGALDLIPIFSYLALRGKCRYCGSKISPRYVLVEFITGVLFALAVFLNANLILPYLVFVSFSIVLSFIDIDNMEVDVLILAIPLVIIFIYNILTKQYFSLYSSVLLFAIHLFVFLVSRQGFGFGDVIYSIIIGLMISLNTTLFWFITTYGIGSIYGIALMFRRKASRKTPVPFLPFMFIGTLITIFFGQSLWQMYLNLFNI